MTQKRYKKTSGISRNNNGRESTAEKALQQRRAEGEKFITPDSQDTPAHKRKKTNPIYCGGDEDEGVFKKR